MIGAENRVIENRAATKPDLLEEGDALSGSAPRALENPAYNENNRLIDAANSRRVNRQVRHFP